MSLVLDTSATLAWIYPDEQNSAIETVFEKVTAEGAWVPSLWRLEIANVLEMGVRRGRHSSSFRDATFSDLALLDIQIDPDTNVHAWGSTAQLARRHRLTAYDAAYLELALRRDLPLATPDDDLRAAGVAEGVMLMGL